MCNNDNDNDNNENDNDDNDVDLNVTCVKYHAVHALLLLHYKPPTPWNNDNNDNNTIIQ